MKINLRQDYTPSRRALPRLRQLMALLLIPWLVTDAVGGNVIGDIVTTYHLTTYHAVDHSPFEEQACLYGSQALAAPALEARMPIVGAHTKAAIHRAAATAPEASSGGQSNPDQDFALPENPEDLRRLQEKVDKLIELGRPQGPETRSDSEVNEQRRVRWDVARMTPRDIHKKTLDLYDKYRTGLPDNVKDEIVELNIRLVIGMARHYSSLAVQHLKLDDLIQEGVIGLMTARDKFDVSKGYTFATYAVPWIRRNIVRAIDQKEHMIDRPVRMSQWGYQLNLLEDRFQARWGRPPTDKELVVEWEQKYPKQPITLEQLRATREARGVHAGLWLDSPEMATPGADNTEKLNRTLWLSGLLAKLPEREARLIRLSYIDQYSAAEIKAMGIENVSINLINRLIQRGLERLRRLAGGEETEERQPISLSSTQEEPEHVTEPVFVPFEELRDVLRNLINRGVVRLSDISNESEVDRDQVHPYLRGESTPRLYNLSALQQTAGRFLAENLPTDAELKTAVDALFERNLGNELIRRSGQHNTVTNIRYKKGLKPLLRAKRAIWRAIQEMEDEARTTPADAPTSPGQGGPHELREAA